MREFELGDWFERIGLTVNVIVEYEHDALCCHELLVPLLIVCRFAW